MKPNILISIDLETHGHNPLTCAIASIGMVAYNLDGDCIDEYLAWVSPASAFEFGIADEATTQWWANQSAQARRQTTDGVTLLPTALTALADKIEAINTAHNQVIIIARGPQFDCTILRRHFAVINRPVPWKYWQELDHRTLEHIYRNILDQTGKPYPKYTEMYPVAHCALLDAKAQATYVINIKSEAEKTIRQGM